MNKKIIFTVFLIALLSTPACAQQRLSDNTLQPSPEPAPQPKQAVAQEDFHAVWVKMTDDAITLYQQRRHAEAIALAREALALAKEKFGPEHPDTAESMDNLATYLTAEGQYKEAEELYRRALEIIEKNFGPDSEYTAIFLNYLSDFFRKIGKDEEAVKLQERAQEIRRKNR